MNRLAKGTLPSFLTAAKRPQHCGSFEDKVDNLSDNPVSLPIVMWSCLFLKIRI